MFRRHLCSASAKFPTSTHPILREPVNRNGERVGEGASTLAFQNAITWSTRSAEKSATNSPESETDAESSLCCRRTTQGFDSSTHPVLTAWLRWTMLRLPIPVSQTQWRNHWPLPPLQKTTQLQESHPEAAPTLQRDSAQESERSAVSF
jgi:hypothetical protein